MKAKGARAAVTQTLKMALRELCSDALPRGFERTTPAAPAKERDLLLDGAATPPNLGGDSVQLIKSPPAKRERDSAKHQ